MNKDQLVDAVTEQVGDRRTAAVAVEAVLVTVQRAVSTGEKVSLFGFGVFEKADRAARSARNPATGAPVSVAATSVPRFRAGQSFKDVVSGAKPAPELLPVSGPPLARAPRRAPGTAPAAVDTPVEVTEAGREAAAQAAPDAAAQAPAKAAKAPAKAAKAAKAPAKTAKAPAKAGTGGKRDSAKKADAKKGSGKKADAKKADGRKGGSDAKAKGKAGAKGKGR